MSAWERHRHFDLRLAGYSKETNTATVEMRQGLRHRARLALDTLRAFTPSAGWVWFVVGAWMLRFVFAGDPMKGGRS